MVKLTVREITDDYGFNSEVIEKIANAIIAAGTFEEVGRVSPAMESADVYINLIELARERAFQKAIVEED